MLELKKLYKSFQGQEVLKDINFQVQQGDVIAILGPSGSGKTTLLRCLNFLELADQGSLIFNDEEIVFQTIRQKNKILLRQRMGFVFQNYNLFQNKTVLENVTEGLIIARRVPKEIAIKRAEEACDKVGLYNKYNSYPHQLSGGQQQRVGIARAIVTQPELLLLDEPTSALDPEWIDEVLSVIKQLADEGMTMILVTHEMNFARQVATKIMMMDQGELIEQNKPDEFFQHPQMTRTKQFLSTWTNQRTRVGNGG